MELEISVGKSRHETNWRNIKTTWDQLVKKLSVTHRTHESLKEYHEASKDRQSEIKDIGGFVGGVITGGRRRNGSVLYRSMLTFDVDYADKYFLGDLKIALACAWCMYSTHTHTVQHPKYRLIVPLDKVVPVDQYQAIIRKVSATVGMDYFDPVSFRPTQLMYWPSTPIDGTFVFEENKGEPLNVELLLRSYIDWRDTSQWDYHKVEKRENENELKKQGDPTEKPGVVGAWCRTYTISEVIEKFLSEEYIPSDSVENRYTYTKGSTANGLVVYDDDMFAYSHHGTDPISNKLCNSFDLVRLHKFGELDDKASYKAMVEFAAKDELVRKQLVDDRYNNAINDFKDGGSLPANIAVDGESKQKEDQKDEIKHSTTEITNENNRTGNSVDNEWKKKLEVDKHGTIYPTINNIMLIIDNDLQGCFAFNAFEQREVVLKDLPWRKIKKGETDYMTDADDSGLRHYLERVYGITGVQRIKDAITNIFARYKFHPVRDYLRSVVWDGNNRIETLLIEYFGAEDNEYVRNVTRKTFIAAVKRIYEPGCKFDYVLTLVGPQGQKKSTFWDRLAKHWFSDTFTTVEGNRSIEQLQGVWIIEIGELAGFKRSEQEAIKNFISRRFDRMRVAYGKRVETFYRQCIFVGTTNNRNFLTDPTGNRRYWAVEIDPIERTKDVNAHLSASEIDQVWAEAVHLYNTGEQIYLSSDVEVMAVAAQEAHTEIDERTDSIARYLDMPIPKNWQELNIWQRRNYINGDTELATKDTVMRDKVTVYEICTELLGWAEKDITKYNTRDIHNIMQNMPGWERYKNKMRVGDKVIRGYVRKNVKENYWQQNDLNFLN